MLTGQPHQQLRPSTLQHGADGGVVRARQLAEGPRGFGRHPKRCNASLSEPYAVRRTHQGGGINAGQHLTPGRLGGTAVPTGEPGNKPAIRDRRGQPLPVVAGKYFLQQDRQRPAIHHDVVKGEHKSVPVLCGADQSGPKRRLVSEVADRGAFCSAHPLDLLIDVDSGVQLDIPPHRYGIGRDDLHRLVELFRESGRQVRMPLDHRLHRFAQPVLVKRASSR